MEHQSPKRIFLQAEGNDPDPETWEGATWCEDKQNDTDVEYIRADLAQPVEASAVQRVDYELQAAVSEICAIHKMYPGMGRAVTRTHEIIEKLLKTMGEATKDTFQSGYSAGFHDGEEGGVHKSTGMDEEWEEYKKFKSIKTREKTATPSTDSSSPHFDLLTVMVELGQSNPKLDAREIVKTHLKTFMSETFSQPSPGIPTQADLERLKGMELYCKPDGTLGGRPKSSQPTALPETGIGTALHNAPVHRLGETPEAFIERYKEWYRSERVPALSQPADPDESQEKIRILEEQIDLLKKGTVIACSKEEWEEYQALKSQPAETGVAVGLLESLIRDAKFYSKFGEEPYMQAEAVANRAEAILTALQGPGGSNG